MSSNAAVRGLNHITLSVSDLARSFDFYARVLGFAPKARWDKGAYLEAGDLWLARNETARSWIRRPPAGSGPTIPTSR